MDLRSLSSFSFTYRTDERLQKWNQVVNSIAKNGCSSFFHTSAKSSNYKWKIKLFQSQKTKLEFKIARLYWVENIILGIIVRDTSVLQDFPVTTNWKKKSIYIYTLLTVLGTKTFSTVCYKLTWKPLLWKNKGSWV